MHQLFVNGIFRRVRGFELTPTFSPGGTCEAISGGIEICLFIRFFPLVLSSHGAALRKVIYQNAVRQEPALVASIFNNVIDSFAQKLNGI